MSKTACTLACLVLLVACISLPEVSGQGMRMLRRPISSGPTPTPTPTPTPAPCTYTGEGTLAFWYKMNAESYANNDPIGTFTDQSGNGINATASGSNRPTYKTSQINSLAAADFDGTDDYLLNSISTYNQPNTVFIVAKELTGTDQVMLDGNSGRHFVGVSGGIFYLYTTALLNCGAQSPNTWRVYEAVFDGASSELLYNGVSQATGNTGVDPLSLNAVIGAGVSGTYPFKGQIAELLFYDSITSPNRATIRACLQAKYGL